MNKTQFLALLSEKLSEELPRSMVLGQVEYYDSYINSEMAKGRSEEEVMAELGDPYMIARTIIDTQTGEAFETQGYTEDVYTEPEDPAFEQDCAKEYRSQTVMRGNHSCLIAAIFIILIALVVVAVLGSVISFLWPILAPVLLILLAVSVFRDKHR